MIAVTIQSNKVALNEVKRHLSAPRTNWQKTNKQTFGQPNILDPFCEEILMRRWELEHKAFKDLGRGNR